MSSDDQRISVDEFLSHARPVAVDTLDATTAHAPWSRDVGLASLRSATYGVVDIVLTHGNVVYFGHDTVIAEQMQPEDAGTVLAIDVAELGWSRDQSQRWGARQVQPPQARLRREGRDGRVVDRGLPGRPGVGGGRWVRR